ncbi:TorF family putative porin [Inhella sp.]|uniref:TorF family putative porin n=1 Tax=Inhella sp. TaxID=1921806 RepID=UPI0035B0C5A9
MIRPSRFALVPVLAAALALPAAPALADVAFNASLTSDYRYRGISQTRLKPALQGGVDYSAGAFYLGAWGSTIKWIKDGGGGADVELDVYGGYKTEIASGLTLDVGLLQYYYPSHDLAVSPNTLEAYGALTAGPATLKISRSFKNLFGFADSKGSMYYDLSATFDLGDGWSVTPHIGRQTVKNNKDFTYTDASLMVNKTIDALTFSAGVVDAKTGFYVGPGNKDLGARRVVASVKYAF